MFSRPLEEVIRARHSVRNFTSQAVLEVQLSKIQHVIHDIENPLDGKVTLKLIQKSDFTGKENIGTYGMVNVGEMYLVSACGEEDKDALSLGYMLEKTVLFCTDLGLGSVWMGGAFNRTDIKRMVDFPEDQEVRIVVPIGYEGGRKTILGSIIGNKHEKRKSFQELFFEESFDKPLTEESSGRYLKALQMVRIAPSGMNNQPWRLLINGNRIDFFSASKNDLNMIEIGIALGHFIWIMQEEGLSCKIEKKEAREETRYSYVISVITEE